jgi:hypothetical protein
VVTGVQRKSYEKQKSLRKTTLKMGTPLNSFNEKFYKLGEAFGKSGELNREIITQLAQPEKFSKFDFLLYKFTGEKLYWNNLLKKNGAYNNQFDRRMPIRYSKLCINFTERSLT